MDKKQLVRDFMNNKKTEKVPSAFWYHFVSFHNHHMGLEDPEVLKTVIAGEKKYYDDVDPDFVKIMSDGFFGHPSVCKKLIQTTEDLAEIKSVGAEHPWITKQVEYVKEVCEHIGEDTYKFYTVFSPLQFIRLRFEEYDEDFEKFVRLFNEAPDVMVAAAAEIAKDLEILLKELFEKTSIDGIYYSVQAVQDESFDYDRHKKLVEPWDMITLNEIRKYTDEIMLHICGYGHYTNELKWYKDYPVKIFNWATHTEGVGLKEGKDLFEGKAVLGGFDNNPESILYNGSEAELKAEIHKILDEAGTVGVALGADCTIRDDIGAERLKMIEKIAAKYE